MRKIKSYCIYIMNFCISTVLRKNWKKGVNITHRFTNFINCKFDRKQKTAFSVYLFFKILLLISVSKESNNQILATMYKTSIFLMVLFSFILVSENVSFREIDVRSSYIRWWDHASVGVNQHSIQIGSRASESHVFLSQKVVEKRCFKNFGDCMVNVIIEIGKLWK